MANNNDLLQEKLKNLPLTAGCYLFYNIADQLIYVGKAKNLSKRVNNYFHKIHNLKTTHLVNDIANLKIIVTSNEKEALLLEHNLIKKHRPQYNILLSDDKTYPYIEITREKDPEYRYVRRVVNNHGKYYGPFPDGSGARDILKILQQLFPLRRCKGNLGHPCLYYHLHLCSGACFKEVDPKYYLDMKRKINKFFQGKITDIRKQITKRMQQAAENMQYEEAGRIKNVIDKLELFNHRQNVQFEDYKNRDFIGFYLEDNSLAITTLFYRNGQLLSKDEQIFRLFTDDVTDAISNYLQQLYSVNTLPDELYINNLILDSLAAIFKINIVNKPSKQFKEILNIATKNAHELLKQHITNTYQVQYRYFEIMNALGKVLEIATPNYIEIMDIANLGDEHVVGGVIVYQNGQAAKKFNRRYNLNSVNKGDYHYLQNLTYRRFWKKIIDKAPLPDLIIVDGGKIQIEAIKNQLQILNLDINVVGLVKNKHHKTAGLLNMVGDEVAIPKKSALFNWLTKVQEEVHNYTITLHRQRRANSLFTNSLMAIKGLSTQKINQLYARFETLSKIRLASFEELNAVIKNKTTTQTLIEYLTNN